MYGGNNTHFIFKGSDKSNIDYKKCGLVLLENTE
jgi:hypothetical protein